MQNAASENPNLPTPESVQADSGAPPRALKERLYEVDLFRFLAAMAVVLFHYGHRGWIRDGLSPVTFPELSPFFQYGHLGVNFFFMISGFVIVASITGRTWWTFLKARVVRLYPAYWACLFLTAGLMWASSHRIEGISLSQILINLTMLQEFVRIPHVDGIYWSLTVELKFYGLVAVLLFLKQEQHVEMWLGIWLVLSMIDMTFPVPGLAWIIFPLWSGYFIAGAAFSQVYRNGWSFGRSVLVLGSLAVCLMSLVERARASPLPETTTMSVLVPSVLFFFGTFLLIVNGHTRGLRKQRFLLLGSLSYPLYLLHQYAGFVAFRTFETAIPRFPLLIAILAVMLATSYLVHIAAEKPVTDLLRRALFRKPRKL